MTGRWFVTAERRSLEGIVVCDFAWVGAGSITTSLMAQLGAEVIKIETAARPDVLRLSGPFKDGVARGLERSGYFASRNPNKKSVALNMTHPDARAVALDLIARSDVVINNFRVGQMEKWGLGWDDLRGGNPRLIYVTMSLQGAAGPHSAFMGFGVNLNALSGLTAQSAFPGKRPFGTGTHYTDHVMVPAHTLFGILAALADREETGLGQMVEVSQLEAAVCMKPLDAMAWSANRDILGPIGFGDPDAAPHGVFSTLCPEAHRHQKQNRRGDGLCPTQTAGGVLKDAPRSAPTSEHRCKWVAITVFTEREWGALKRVMGHPPWAEEPRFGTIQARKASEQELNARLEDWTNRHTAGELVEKLVGAGVSAGIVHDARGVIEDENLTERGFWCYLDHPEMGRTLYNRAPFILSETPAALRTAAPLLGQHTREVLTAFLEYTEAEVKNLRSRGVLG